MDNEDKKLLNNNEFFAETPFLNEEVEKIIAFEEEKKEAILVYSPNPNGKNYAFKNILSKKEGNKIIVDFNDQPKMSSFPAHYLVNRIYGGFKEFGIYVDGNFPEIPINDKTLDAETTYDVALGKLKTDLYSLKLDEPLYILLCNIDLPFENDYSLTFYRHMLFDKVTLPKNLHVFLITSNSKQAELYKEYLNVVTIEGNKDDPKQFFEELLKKHGRQVDEELLESANPNLKICDYLYIAGYAINYGGLKEYNLILKKLLNKNNTDEVLLEIFNDLYAHLSKFGKAIFAEALLDLYMFNFGLMKNEIVNSGRYLLKRQNSYLKDYEEISREEKDLILTYLEFFTVLKGDRLVITDRIIKEFIGNNAMYLTKLVTNVYKERLFAAVDHAYGENSYIMYGGYKTQKIVYTEEFYREKRFDKRNIARYSLFSPLSDRLAEFISNYSYIIQDVPFTRRRKLNELEVFMLGYIEKASTIFELNCDCGIIDDFFENKYLMYHLVAISRRATKRIINNGIQGFFAWQRATYRSQNVDKYSVSTLTASLFSYLFKTEEDDILETRKGELILLLGEVLDENSMLLNGNIKDEYRNYSICPITDFALINGHELLDDLNDLIETTKEEKIDFNYLKLILEDSVDGYQNDDNVFHKLIYACIAFRAFIVLGDNLKTTKEISELLNPVVQDVLIYTEYCYFPEMYGLIYMYFGRLYVQDHLDRLELGLNILKSQGYHKTCQPFEHALKYFSSLKNKEDM